MRAGAGLIPACSGAMSADAGPNPDVPALEKASATVLPAAVVRVRCVVDAAIAGESSPPACQ